MAEILAKVVRELLFCRILYITRLLTVCIRILVRRPINTMFKVFRQNKRQTEHTAVITFCASRRRRKMYCGHARLCVSVCLSVCLSVAVRPHYCTDPDVTWARGRGCPLDVHYWADLQSVHIANRQNRMILNNFVLYAKW